MSVTRPLLTAGLLFLLTSCGYLSENPKAALEQQWLQQDPQIAEAVKQIREQGLAAVAGSAEAGTVAACVASRLAADPMGKLITVEGALVESAKVAQLLADIEQVFSQELSFDSVAALLEQGADAAAYAKTLVDQQGIEQALQTLKTLVSQTQQFASKDLGGHLQALISTCRAYEVEETTPAADASKT